MLAIGIPSFERPYALACCLASLLSQDRRPDVLLIVDQSSATVPLPRQLVLMLRAWSFTETEVVYMPDVSRWYTWSARRRIVAMASAMGADRLLFTDDDMVFLPGAVRALDEVSFASECVFAMGTHVSADLERQGWSEPSELSRRNVGPAWHWYDQCIGSQEIDAEYLTTGYVLMLTSVWVSAFRELADVPLVRSLMDDPAFVGSDDMAIKAWLMAKGYRGYLVPMARAVHASPDSGAAAMGDSRRARLERQLLEAICGE